MPTGKYPRKSVLERFMANVNSDWQWTGAKNKAGYGKTQVNRKKDYAHRVSYKLFVGPIPEGMQVLHSCDDPGCVNPDCLHLGNQHMNIQEMLSRGRCKAAKGEASGRSKLTEQQVIEIRHKAEQGFTQTFLAKEYHVATRTICSIVHRENWKYLK